MARTVQKVRSLTAADLGLTTENTTPADPTVRVLEGTEELWRGPLSDFFDHNVFMEAEERDDVTEHLRATGRATIGGGAAPIFTVEKVS